MREGGGRRKEEGGRRQGQGQEEEGRTKKEEGRRKGEGGRRRGGEGRGNVRYITSCIYLQPVPKASSFSLVRSSSLIICRYLSQRMSFI
jgi:hypothetical protein